MDNPSTDQDRNRPDREQAGGGRDRGDARLYEDARASPPIARGQPTDGHATIRAQELTEEAEAAKARTAESERELRADGEFRDSSLASWGMTCAPR